MTSVDADHPLEERVVLDEAGDDVPGDADLDAREARLDVVGCGEDERLSFGPRTLSSGGERRPHDEELEAAVLRDEWRLVLGVGLGLVELGLEVVGRVGPRRARHRRARRTWGLPRRASARRASLARTRSGSYAKRKRWSHANCRGACLSEVMPETRSWSMASSRSRSIAPAAARAPGSSLSTPTM